MAWQDQLRPASFRGVPFKTFGHEASGFGRRAQVHEYPKRDQAFVEDTGAQTRAFSFEAYVLGPDYFADRDALIDACRETGPGTLVHPYLGTFEVACLECRPSETTRNGGMVVFQLRFVEAGTNRFPTERPDTGQLVEDAASSGDTTIKSVFEDLFSTEDGPQWVVDEATIVIQDLADALTAAAAQISGSAGDPADFTRDVAALKSGAAALAADSKQLASDAVARVADFAALALTESEGVTALEALSSWGSALPVVSKTTPNRSIQAQNQDSLIGLVRQAAAIQAAKGATQIELTSYGEAVALRDRVAALLDAQIDVVGDGGSDDVLRALAEMLAEVVRDINVRSRGLARITTFVPTSTSPVLLIAYRIYGDADRADEIVDRNALPHAGFAQGGEALEVLSV